MKILAIESTCDETGACVAEKTDKGVVIISETKASSAEITAKYGGVVPEVVAREQLAAMIPVVETAMSKANIKPSEIEAVAVSYGPGLIGSLLMGVETAKALAWAWEKKLFKVNHVVAHVFANWILENDSEVPELPAIALIVSGGHTDLVLLKSLDSFEWIGGTRDDAAGEAFDKAARAMGLPYPGGSEIARLAEQSSKEDLPEGFKLPRPMIREENLEMSFSGLKTAVVDLIRKHQDELKDDPLKTALLAREFNEAVVEVLIAKTMKAISKYQPKSIILAGGVAANKLLRDELKTSCEEWKVRLFVPNLKYCTDNAAMIAAAALMRPVEADINLTPSPNLEVCD